MTLAELIAKVEILSPSEYDKDELTQWVNEVEFLVVDQAINKAEGPRMVFVPYSYDKDFEKTLIVPDQFGGVYTSYLNTKIDYNNREIERYNLDAQQFESEWQTFASWYRREHKPRRIRHEISDREHSPINPIQRH